jgi:hypothetical protein
MNVVMSKEVLGVKALARVLNTNGLWTLHMSYRDDGRLKYQAHHNRLILKTMNGWS